MNEISWIDSIILGIVQGLTEFFPVSSDGHLALAEHFLGYQAPGILFDVMLHLGTLGSLLFVFHRDVRTLLRETAHRLPWWLSREGRRRLLTERGETRWIVSVWLTTFVTGVAGILLEKTVETNSADIRLAGVGFLVTSVALFLGSARRGGIQTASQMALSAALIIGLCQSLALFTGVSRSGLTIAAALTLGLRRDEAGRFSFVASVPIITLAILYQMRKLDASMDANTGVLMVGVLTSFVVGLVAIKGLMAMLTKLSLVPFAVYTAILGVACFMFGGDAW